MHKTAEICLGFVDADETWGRLRKEKKKGSVPGPDFRGTLLFTSTGAEIGADDGGAVVVRSLRQAGFSGTGGRDGVLPANERMGVGGGLD